MPRAYLSFRLPQDQDAHKHALNGGKYKAMLDKLDQWCRNLSKYDNVELLKVEEVRAKIRELFNEYFND